MGGAHSPKSFKVRTTILHNRLGNNVIQNNQAANTNDQFHSK